MPLVQISISNTALLSSNLKICIQFGKYMLMENISNFKKIYAGAYFDPVK